MRKKRTTRKVPKATKKYVKKALDKQIENKYTLSLFPSTGIAITGLFRLYNGLIQGTGVDQRVGQRINLKKLHIGISAANGNVAASSRQVIRFILFKDTQANGVAPVMTDLITATYATSPVTAPLNPVNVPSRFKILKDIRLNLDADSLTPKDIERKIVIKLKGQTQYNTNVLGNIGDITKNSLYGFYVSQVGANIPSFIESRQFTFEDA